MPRYTLNFRKDEKSHIISGSTYEWKDAIKALEGARWSREEQVWRIPLATNMEPLLEAYERHIDATVPKRGRCCDKAKLWSPNGGFDTSVEGWWFASLTCVCEKHGSRTYCDAGD